MPANRHPCRTDIAGAHNSHTALVLHAASGSDADKRAMQAPSVDQDQVRSAATAQRRSERDRDVPATQRAGVAAMARSAASTAPSKLNPSDCSWRMSSSCR